MSLRLMRNNVNMPKYIVLHEELHEEPIRLHGMTLFSQRTLGPHLDSKTLRSLRSVFLMNFLYIYLLLTRWSRLIDLLWLFLTFFKNPGFMLSRPI